jgi:hypothetical protein
MSSLIRLAGDLRSSVALLLLALGVRVLCAWRTVAPDRDCANYLDIAAAFEGGDVAAALGSVFPPLHPLWLSCFAGFAGPAPEARWIAGIAAVLVLELVTVLLLVRLGRSIAGPGPARWLAPIFFATGMLPAWQVADVMSEGLFRLLLALWLLAWLRVWPAADGAGPKLNKPDKQGLLALLGVTLLPALLFWTRPEGAVLFGAVFVYVWRVRSAAAGLGSCLGLALAISYPLLRGRMGHGFALLPKAGFNAPLSAAADDGLLAGLGHYLGELAQFAGQGFDGLGYLAYPLCLLALPAAWRDARLRWPLLAVLLALLVVPGFFAHRRFWTAWLPLLLPVAALALRAPLAGPRRRWLWALILVSLLPHGLRLGLERREGLRADITLARELRTRALPPKAVASDLQRLLFFAGQPAPPPRGIEADELMRWAARSTTRVVVSREPRHKLDSERLRELGYRPLRLSPEVARWNSRRRLSAWIR